MMGHLVAVTLIIVEYILEVMSPYIFEIKIHTF